MANLAFHAVEREIIRSLGLDDQRVTAITLRFAVGQLPTAIAEMVVKVNDELVQVVKSFHWAIDADEEVPRG